MPDTKNYLGRGISVCDRWLKFENFLADMGVRPDRMTIDRIDVNGDYTPENCRWVDIFTQGQNKRAPSDSQFYIGVYEDFFEACCARKSSEILFWNFDE